MAVWLDRDGRRIDEREAAVRRRDPAYCQVARTAVADLSVAGWTFEVITVWLGRNVADEAHRVELFETRVAKPGGSTVFIRRYATECAAIMAHGFVVTTVTEGMISPVVVRDIPAHRLPLEHHPPECPHLRPPCEDRP